MTPDEVTTQSPADETEAVWRLATSLARSESPGDVAEALVQQGGPAAGGSAVSVAVLDTESSVLRVVHHPAIDPAIAARWTTIGLSQDVPPCEAILTGLPVLLGSADEIRRRFPGVLAEIAAAGFSAAAAVPLHSASGSILGAADFGWREPQIFTAAQLRRLDLVAQLTGLALERSLGQNPRPWQDQSLPPVLDGMPSAFVSLDKDFRITSVNAEGERLLRAPREELVGSNFSEAFGEVPGGTFGRQCRHAIETGQPVTFEGYAASLATWLEVHAWPDRHGLNITFWDISGRRNAEIRRVAALREAQRSNARLSFLTELSSRLAGLSTRSEVFEQLSHAVVPLMADWCTIVLPRGQELARVAALHRDPALDRLAKRLVDSYPHSFSGPSPGVVVYRDARPLRLDRLASQIITDLDDSGASAAYGRTLMLLGDGPGLITPVIAGGEVVAVLTMVRSVGGPFSAADGGMFTDAEVSVIQEAAARVATALDDARHAETQRETASALQAASLPPELPVLATLSLAACYRAASEGSGVGGDWYDAFDLQTGRISLVVGDVAGHGLQAAAVMAQMRNALRAHLFDSLGPSESLIRLSGQLAIQEPNAMATIICADIDPLTGAVTWASAGHPAPILVSGAGTSAYLQGRPAPPIGVTHLPSVPPPLEHRLTLQPGDRLLLFTDGLIEQRGTALDIGLAHLMILAEQTRGTGDATTACETILREILPRPHEDDACLLIADFKH
jgi:serine phosphatase RsbU (regulator of sigma subunit)